MGAAHRKVYSPGRCETLDQNPKFGSRARAHTFTSTSSSVAVYIYLYRLYFLDLFVGFRGERDTHHTYVRGMQTNAKHRSKPESVLSLYSVCIRYIRTYLQTYIRLLHSRRVLPANIYLSIFFFRPEGVDFPVRKKHRGDAIGDDSELNRCRRYK